MRALLLLALAACGPSAGAWVTIEAPLRVPDQCDSVRVTAARGADEVFNSARVIPAGQQFPQTLSLYASKPADVGAELTVTVVALLGGQPATSWSTASTTVTLEDGKLTPVDVRLTNPLP